MATGVSILICTYNRRRVLAQTLEGLTRLRVPAGVDAELILVCNACTDGSEDVGREWSARMPFAMRVVGEPEPGLSVARNRAIAEARHDILVFTDDDVLVDPDWLDGLLDIYRTRGERVGIVGGRVDLWWEAVERPAWLPKELEWLLASHDRGDQILELSTPDLFGANFSLRREVFGRVGPFRTDLGRKGSSLGGFEEAVFIESAIRAGFGVFYTPRASVRHWVHPERATQRYMSRLVFEYSRQRVLLPERASVRLFARTLAGGLWRIVRHGIGVMARRRGAESAALLRHRVEFHSGRGLLGGLWSRILGRSMADLNRA